MDFPQPKLISGMPVAQFEIGTLKNFVYLIADWEGRRAAIVDPQKDLATPLAELEKNGLHLDWILLTHTHFDHIAGVPGVLDRFPEIRIGLGKADAHRLPDRVLSAPGLQYLEDGSTLRVGSIEARVLATPGHSPGELCYFLPGSEGRKPYLFTGDTLFIRDCGRTDFEGGSNAQMFASLQKIKTLPDESVILVGHHYAPELASTLAKEKMESPPLRFQSVEELEKFE